MKTKFNPSQFTPTEFATSNDKAKFANQFVSFVQSGFDERQFPEWFYCRLSKTFGHIAHYNQAEFFDAFFTTPKGKVDFIDQCLAGDGVGDPEYTYADVERELKRWLIENDVVGEYREKFLAAVEEIERAWAAAAPYRRRAIR